MKMKKTYMTPSMDIYTFQPGAVILTTSTLVPTPGGGGEAGSRLFDESELELFQNDDLEMIYKELGM